LAIPPTADVAEPRAGSRHLVLGERNLGPRGALAEIGGDPADV